MLTLILLEISKLHFTIVNQHLCEQASGFVNLFGRSLRIKYQTVDVYQRNEILNEE